VAKAIGLNIIVYYIVPIMLKMSVRIEKSDAPYIGVYFIVISNNKYYIYAAKPSQIPVSSRYLKIYI